MTKNKLVEVVVLKFGNILKLPRDFEKLLMPVSQIRDLIGQEYGLGLGMFYRAPHYSKRKYM